MHRSESHLIQAIRSNHPEFFENFAAEIQSGDHVRVREALQHAARVTLQVLAEEQGITTQQLLKQTRTPEAGHGLFIVWGVYIFLIVALEYLFTYFIGVLEIETDTSFPLKDRDLQLSQEQLIDRITVVLANP